MRSVARTRLASAQVGLERAHRAVATAEEFCAGGEQFVALAKEALRSLSEREGASEAETAQAIKAALKEGRSPPRAVAIQGGRARAEAEAELAARESALKLLNAELAEARAAEEAAQTELRLAIKAVLAEDAAVAAEEGLQALEMIHRAYRRVSAADRVGHGGALGRLELSPAAIAFLQRAPAPHDQALRAAAAVGQWVDYKAALETNPDAVPPTGELPPLKQGPMPGERAGTPVNLGLVSSNWGGPR
jgi:hypothetical protein